MSGEAEAELERAIAPTCQSKGVELVDVEIRAGTVLVTVERADGLDLDMLAEVAQAVSAELDTREALAPKGRYELEVTSPGLERRLRRPEHFAKVLGERVAIRTVAGTPGDRRIEGELAGVDEDGIVVDQQGNGSIRHLAYREIDRAHTIFDWRNALRASKEQLAREKATSS